MNRRAVLVTVGVGTFMSALDGSVVNTLHPVLARELHTSVAGIEWVTTPYLFVISGLLLLASLAAQGTLPAIAGVLALVGLGVGTFVSPNNSARMGAAPRHRQGIAAGGLATARNVGMVLGG